MESQTQNTPLKLPSDIYAVLHSVAHDIADWRYGAKKGKAVVTKVVLDPYYLILSSVEWRLPNQGRVVVEFPMVKVFLGRKKIAEWDGSDLEVMGLEITDPLNTVLASVNGGQISLIDVMRGLQKLLCESTLIVKDMRRIADFDPVYEEDVEEYCGRFERYLRLYVKKD